MKNPPTLADACIATALDKRMANNPGRDNSEIRSVLLSVAQARKFVLDPHMSGYLYDMSQGFWTGGLRKRLRLLENARQMARLPHELTWIEYDNRACLKRAEDCGHKIIRPANTAKGELPTARIGWLIRQHPKIETAFFLTHIPASIIMPDRALPHPVSMVWCSDDTPLPWRTIKLWKDEPDAEFLVMMKGYRSTQLGWTFSFGEPTSAAMMHSISRVGSMGLRPDTNLRDVWALLATLNDLPVTIEHVTPSKGYISRGSYKKFLKHSIVRLTVPETHWRKLVSKTTTILRRRAHQVRGHWRIDWHNRPSKLCDHDWVTEDTALICRRCHGHQFWIPEHQRGDASLGFVTHDYSVEHKNA